MSLTIAELAILVLHGAVDRAGSGRVDAAEVRLALRCLLRVGGDRQLLGEFWTYAGQPHTANRQDSCAAVLRSIITDLQAAGHYPDSDLAHRRLIADRVRAEGRDQAARTAISQRHYWAPPRRRPG
jgi:hypothetical protein